MNSKNPYHKSGYELRTDILGMATGLLEANREQATMAFYARPDEERQGERSPVITITTDQIIQTAEELYSFVNRTD